MFAILLFAGCVEVPKAANDSESLLTINHSEAHKNLKADSEKILDAVLTRDYDTVADFTYDPYVSKFGGREGFLERIRQGVKDLDENAILSMKVILEESQPILSVDGELVSLVPLTVTFNTAEGKRRGKDSMVGISTDQGKRWKFISGVNNDQFKALFPAIAERIRIPDDPPPDPVDQ